MKTWKRLFAIIVITLSVTAVAPGRAGAAAIASDNACNTPYGGTNWTNGQNGGTGFGAWSLYQTGGGTSSFFTASASDNGNGCSSGSGINGSCGKSWGAFANTGAVANARRAFTGSPNSLQTNQSFAFSIDNGYVDNSGGAVGVALENSSNNSVWEFLYIGGNNGGHYSINDSSGNTATSVGYLESGLVVVFTLTSSTSYSVTITSIGGSTTTMTGTLPNPAGGQAISQFRFYNYEPLSGNGCNYNCFLNTISVACPSFTVSTPANQSICAGSTVSFSVSTTTFDSPGYQWQVSTNGGVTWSPVSSGTGGTTTNYTTAATAAGDNGTLYRCAVSVACGNTIASSAASLAVMTFPIITSQPTNQTGYVSDSVGFSVVASGASSHQWYKGPTGSGVELGNGGSISGATSAALTLSGLASGDNGASFYDVITGCGGLQTSSASVTLSVLPGTAPFVTMTMSPTIFSNSAGSQVTFTAGFGGPHPIFYQWQFNNGSTNVNLAGATNTILSLTNLQTSDSGTYTLIASNFFGVSSLTVVVTITPLGPFEVRNFFSSEFHPKDNGWFTAPWSQSDPGWRYQLSQQPNLSLTQPGGPTNYTIITVNPAVIYQTITGIGTSLDESSCYAIQRNHTDEQIKDILRQWLDPGTGTGYSLFRICFGTSDFSDARAVATNYPQGWYSYQDNQNSPFSITNDVKLGIIRVIRLAQQVLQESGQPMQILGSAWSPPGWMKDSGVMTGGNLLSTMNTQYAIYLKNAVLAYQALGIPIYAVTVNNEHYFSTSSYPSCTFNATTEGALVEEIGKQFKTNNVSTRIWILDHNWDLQADAQQTLGYLKNSTPNGEGYGFCDAVAFHHYSGDPTEMTTLHNAYPDKDVQFTEGSVWGTAGINEIVQDFRNWCKSYMIWVPMVTQDPTEHIQGPYNTVGPLSPTIFIKTSGSGPDYYRTPEYFLIGQLSKFVRPGAIRIDSNSGGPISNVAFQNPDGRIVVVVVNQNSAAQNFMILCQGNQITATIPAATVATYLFNSGVTSTNPPPPVISVETKPDGTGAVVPPQSLVAGASANVYAIARNAGGSFIGNVAATWSLQNITGDVAGGDLAPAGDGKSATFTGHLTGSAVIQAFAGTAGQSGVQTVLTGTVSQTTVETKADGTGVVVPSQSLVAGSSVTVYAIARDVGGNFLSNTTSTWSLQNITGGVAGGDLVPAGDGKSATFTGHLTGSAVIRAVANTFAGQSGALAVNPGSVTQLIWSTQPGSAISGMPFGQQPVLKAADQFGNPSTSGLASTRNVTVALSAGTGPLLGTTNYNIGTSGNNGVVSFTDLQIDVPGTSNQLTASWLSSSLPPASIANCQLWLDANDLSTLTLSNGLVTKWADKSGNGDNATAGTAPTFGTNAHLSGSGRVVRFNGSSSYLNVNLSALAGQPYTILALEVDGAKSGQNSYFIGNTGGSTDQALHMGYYNNTTFRLGHWADDLSYNGAYTSTTTPRLWSGKLDTNVGRFLYLNGTQVAALSTTTTVSGALASGHIGGAFDTSTSLYQGDLAEIAVYNRALSDAERVSVENYSQSKWLPGHSSTAVSSVFTVQPSSSQTSNSVNQFSGVQFFSGTNVAITIPFVAGETYQLQYSSSVSPANWIDVGGAAVTNSLGSTLTFTNFGGASQPQGFYRFHITTP